MQRSGGPGAAGTVGNGATTSLVRGKRDRNGECAVGGGGEDTLYDRRQCTDGGVRGVPPAHIHGVGGGEGGGRGRDLEGTKVGVFSDWFNDGDQEVLEPCRRVVEELKQRGAEVVEISIPNMQWLRLAHAAKISSEFALGWDSINHHTDSKMEPNSRITVALGSTFTALEVLAAERLRRFAFDHMVELFANHSLSGIVTPTLPSLPPLLNEDARECGESNVPMVVEIMKFIFLANFLGLHAISTPVAFHSGLPIGFQVIGQHWGENDILKIAMAVEEATKQATQRPKDYTDLLSEN